MNLHGWRQLIEWSIRHASLDSRERGELRDVWQPLWNEFIDWIRHEFGDVKTIKKRPVRPSSARKEGETEKDWQERVSLESQRYKTEEAEFQDVVKEWRTRAKVS